MILLLGVYRLLLPLLFLAAFPGWLIKMLRRNGLGTGLTERIALYTDPPDFEPCGAVHFHAVSVGETLLALKLIRQWRLTEPARPFLLATGTATGHAVATHAAIPGLRVTYAPLDFPSMVRRYLDRFSPSQIVLIEAEVWPHLLLECHRRKLPVRLVNARMSPRSARRFRKFAKPLQALYSILDSVAIQEEEDRTIWTSLGIPNSRIHLTGSLKFDPQGSPIPKHRKEFQNILDPFGADRPVILAASTHPGEEAWIAMAIRHAAPHALPVIVPRHAERRASVLQDLAKAGFSAALRSAHPAPSQTNILVIDTTGELVDWTAHADVVIIGKSFLSTGGQNPSEAILAHKPVIFGPHMQNFQPLANHLVQSGGALTADNPESLCRAIRSALSPSQAMRMTQIASTILARHHGATRRTLDLLDSSRPPQFDASGVCHFPNQSLQFIP
jgi:3-deoxy-D-manno-octulosonic-acid transferase